MRGVSVWAYRERPSGHLFPGVGDGIHEVAPLATEGKVMRPPFVVSLLAVALLAVAFAALPSSEAPTGFDNQSNGMVDDATHQADQVKFDEVENVSDGLGPLYNAQSCRECHQSPVSGGGSQVAELRVGHEGAHHRFENAEIPIARGTEIITGRTLVNDRAICPNGAFPNTEIQERLPDSENVRTTRLSLSLLGDGFVEAVADQTFIELARKQCKETHHKICGQAIFVPILEAPGQTGVGRFGWKDQHASVLSFSGDALWYAIILTALEKDRISHHGEGSFSPDFRDRCRRENDRSRWSPANGRDELDRDTKQRSPRPVRGSRCTGKGSAIPENGYQRLGNAIWTAAATAIGRF